LLDVSYDYLDLFKAKSRHITGSITYINNGNQYVLAPNDNLKSFKIEKTSPNGKFFGFAVSQKITIEALGIIDNIQKGDKLIPSIGIKDFDEDLLLPYFYVDTIDRSKVNNTTTITGYDILYKADYININTLSFEYPMYISAYGRQVCEAFGAYASFDESGFLVKEAPNFGGNETLRSVLTEIAEATGTICYVSQEDTIRFRTLQADFTDVLTADDYYNLTIGEITTLTKVASNTELGNNYEVGSTGFTQVLFENPFITLLDDTDAMTLLTSIGNRVRNLSSVDYSIEWRGCPAYEIGDYVILQDKEGNANYTFYYNETLEYNGGLKATSSWEAGSGDNANTVSGLSKTLRQTYAKVDKVDEKIELVAADVSKIALDSEGVYTYVSDEMAKVDTKLTITKNGLYTYVDDEIKGVNAQMEVTTQGIMTSINDVASGLGSIITQTEQDLTSRITDTKNELESEIQQTESSLSSRITSQGNTITEIRQDLDGIELSYNSTNGTASITIGDITVSNLVNGEYVEKTVAGIELDGYVKFNDLSSSGSTVINGDNITTGTINADRINMRGAISWSDLDSDVQDYIDAGVSGGDYELPDYLHSTYISSTEIRSPEIIGGSLSSTVINNGNTHNTVIEDSKIDFRIEEGNFGYSAGYIDAYVNDAGSPSSARTGLRIVAPWNGDGYTGGLTLEANRGMVLSAGQDIFFYIPGHQGVALSTILNKLGL
jgi:hypothetical protein